MDHHPNFSQELASLRQAVKSSNQAINYYSYTQFKKSFLFFNADPERLCFLQQVSPEYSSLEFLACVDSSGVPLHTSAEILQDYNLTLSHHPSFQNWFSLDIDPNSNRIILLAARWLCHLTGIRHGTAQLLVTIPGEVPGLLVQIRSMAKSASPGCYDLPVAGHVNGLQSYPATLRKESREELELDIDQLAELRQLGGYVETSDEPERMFFNTEYHQVYTGCLSRAQVALLNPLPSEVAAIALFSHWELDYLRQAYPGVFAPSIQQTLDRFKGQY